MTLSILATDFRTTSSSSILIVIRSQFELMTALTAYLFVPCENFDICLTTDKQKHENHNSVEFEEFIFQKPQVCKSSLQDANQYRSLGLKKR